jgi:hypothetical protein
MKLKGKKDHRGTTERRPRKLKLVLVEWVDACEGQNYVRASDAEFEPLWNCVTVGYLLSKTAKKTVIGSTYVYPVSGDDHPDDPQVADLVIIPTSTIRRVWRLKAIARGAGARRREVP